MPDFPDLSGARYIGFDTETKDPELLTRGPGHYRKDSYLVGISLATDDGHKAYYPVRHQGGGNLDENKVFAYVREQLGHAKPIKVGANLTYDILYLRKEGIEVSGRTRDVQIAEPLIDENSRKYSLGSLADKYLGEVKSDAELNSWCAAHFGGRATRRGQAGNYWRVPAHVIRKYAEDDAVLPIQVWKEQQRVIKKESLQDIFELETRLQRPLIEMRHQGVRVDTEKAVILADEWTQELRVLQMQLDTKAGMHVDVWAADSLARAYDKTGVKYPRTAKTKKPSFTKAFLEHLHAIGEPISYFVLRVRSLEKLLSTFVQGGVIDHAENGWVHGEYHQLPTDENGAVTGRLSSSNPNLQNLPSRDSDLAPQVRGLFIPRDGEDWYKFDYSQIEPRLTLSHCYAHCPVARKLIEQYQKDPTLDCYNQMLSTMEDVTRFQVKVLYLGMTYGMGKDKVAAQLGVDLDESEKISNAFHRGAPYIRTITRLVSARAHAKGYITSLLGRRHRFDMWESAEWSDDYKPAMKSKRAALEAYGNVRRAFTYKSLNRLIQGGAATVLKKAIVDCYDSGVWDVTGPPFLNVHDELDHSVPRTIKGLEAAKEIRETMQNAFKLKVPFLVDVEIGPDWGHVKKGEK